jgi:hypothetical protein
MKKIIYTNQEEFSKKIRGIENAKDAFQNLLDEFLSLDLDIQVNNLTDLESLARKGEVWIKSKIEESLPVQKMGNFKIKKEVSIDMLDLPSFSKLNDLAKDVKGGPNHLLGTYVDDSFRWLHYLTLKGNKVIISQDSLQSIKEEFSIICKNEKQEKMLEVYSKAVIVLNQLNEELKAVSNGQVSLNGELKLNNYFLFQPDNTMVTYHLFFERNKVALFS